jgi:hypothetical protein
MANKYRDALVQLHRNLFPERYIPADELDAKGYAFDGNVVEWDAGTIEWVAEAIENTLRGTRAGVVFDSEFRPLTKEQIAKLELTLMPIGGRETTFGTLTCRRDSKDVWHFRDEDEEEDEAGDEDLDGAVQLVLEARENEGQLYTGDLSEYEGDGSDLTPERFATWAKKYAPDPEDE